MILSVLVRRLRPGVSFEEFKAAWLAEADHFGFPIEVSHAQKLGDDREIVSYSLIDASRDDVLAVLATPKVAAGEAERHNRIDALIESAVVSGLYEVIDTTTLT
jgi:hypothetical protein